MSRSFPPQNMADAIEVCFAKYTDFNGRAGRAEYGWFLLFASGLPFILRYTLSFLAVFALPVAVMPTLASLASLVLFIPMLAVQARRLHDVNKSAWWLLLLAIPLFGPLVLLFWSFQKSYEGRTRYDQAYL